MTKAKALREYFQKFHNLKVTGMSEVGVLRDFFKQKYNHDSVGSTVSAILNDATNSKDVPSGTGYDTWKCVITSTKSGTAFPIFSSARKQVDGTFEFLQISANTNLQTVYLIGPAAKMGLTNPNQGTLSIVSYETDEGVTPPSITQMGAATALLLYRGTNKVSLHFE